MLTRAGKRKLPEYEQLARAHQEKENKRKSTEVKPFLKYSGKIKYTTDFNECALVCDDLLTQAEQNEDLLILGLNLRCIYNVLGIMEPGSTAIMLICPSTDDQIVHMFQLSEFDGLPDPLIKLLQHPKIRITGFNIKKIEAEKAEDLLVLGFDLEWPFSYQTGPGGTALMQICSSTNDQVVHLFQLSEFKKLPATLVKLLQHQKVRIAGVNIRNDVHKLSRDFPGFDKEPMINNCVDSRKQARELTGITKWSMDRLVNHFFDKSVDKNKNIRMSKWNILPLSNFQKIYAATDAYISLLLYRELLRLESEEAVNETNPLEELF